MLNSISWGDYVSTVCILLLVYYALIAYLYFKTEILALVGISMSRPAQISSASVEEIRQSFKPERDEDYMPKPDADVDLSPVIQSFKDEISAYAASAAEEKPVKEEALFAIELIAAKYPVLNDLECRTELIEYIHQEAETALPSAFEPQDFKHLLLS